MASTGDFGFLDTEDAVASSGGSTRAPYNVPWGGLQDSSTSTKATVTLSDSLSNKVSRGKRRIFQTDTNDIVLFSPRNVVAAGLDGTAGSPAAFTLSSGSDWIVDIVQSTVNPRRFFCLATDGRIIRADVDPLRVVTLTEVSGTAAAPSGIDINAAASNAALFLDDSIGALFCALIPTSSTSFHVTPYTNTIGTLTRGTPVTAATLGTAPANGSQLSISATHKVPAAQAFMYAASFQNSSYYGAACRVTYSALGVVTAISGSSTVNYTASSSNRLYLTENLAAFHATSGNAPYLRLDGASWASGTLSGQLGNYGGDFNVLDAADGEVITANAGSGNIYVAAKGLWFPLEWTMVGSADGVCAVALRDSSGFVLGDASSTTYRAHIFRQT